MKKYIKYFLGVLVAVLMATLGSDLLGFSNIIIGGKAETEAKDSVGVALDSTKADSAKVDSALVVKADSLKADTTK